RVRSNRPSDWTNRRPERARARRRRGAERSEPKRSCAEPLLQGGSGRDEPISPGRRIAGEGGEAVALQRRGEVESLEIAAAVPAQPQVLGGGLDPFGQDLDAEPPAEREQAAADRLAVAPPIDVGDEGAVDLDLVEAQAA